MTYAIAAYLTDEQKQRACEAVYVPLKADGRLPRANGCCPLGVALWPDGDDRCPIPITVANRLAWLKQIDPNDDAVFQALIDGSRQFMDDWDKGRIPDLYAALGVER